MTSDIIINGLDKNYDPIPPHLLIRLVPILIWTFLSFMADTGSLFFSSKLTSNENAILQQDAARWLIRLAGIRMSVDGLLYVIDFL